MVGSYKHTVYTAENISFLKTLDVFGHKVLTKYVIQIKIMKKLRCQKKVYIITTTHSLRDMK